MRDSFSFEELSLMRPTFMYGTFREPTQCRINSSALALTKAVQRQPFNENPPGLVADIRASTGKRSAGILTGRQVQLNKAVLRPKSSIFPEFTDCAKAFERPSHTLMASPLS